MPEHDETVRVHVWVKGRVQGVGFRAFVESKAGQLSLTGWVRNVGYDTVEAIAEGPRDRIDRFVESMKEGPLGSHVDQARVENEAATGEFSGFQIRRSL